MSVLLLLIWIWVEWFANCEVVADGYVRSLPRDAPVAKARSRGARLVAFVHVVT